MSTTGGFCDWKEMDDWWEEFTETTPLALASDAETDLDSRFVQGHWKDVDAWWDAYVEPCSLVEVPETSLTLDERWIDEKWEVLDPWWNVNVRSQHEALAELQEVLNGVREEWVESASSFDADPLSEDWNSNPRSTGPLRINQEENWSQWLAHAVRSAPPAFSRALFGNEFHQQPFAVEREVHLADPSGTDRYADILLFYEDRGVSIEVKKGDGHYEKTLHTASLIESQFIREWDHYLLLPKYKTNVLRRSFPERLEESADDPPMIDSEQSDDIAVLYWQEISKALRSVLLANSKLDAHWESSAYLFCTLIEQKITGFVPKPIVNRMAESKDVVRAGSFMKFTGSDMENQIAYLRKSMESSEHE